MVDVTWRRHPLHENHEVTTDGRVRHKGKELKPYPHPGGYLMLTIYRSDRPRFVGVHRLVCETFHGLPASPDLQVRHLNGEKHDNRADNLAWGTASENAKDCVGHGTHPQASKTHCHNGHLFNEQNTYFRNDKNGRCCRRCDSDRRRRYRRQRISK